MSASVSDSSGSTTADSSNGGSPLEASFMGVVLLVMFGCLFTGWKTPETVVRPRYSPGLISNNHFVPQNATITDCQQQPPF